MIDVFKPAISQIEIDAAEAVLRSGWIGRGPQVAALEQVWAAYIGAPVGNVLTTSCATEALFQVMAQLGRKPGAVIMPANSYIGTANAALAAGLSVRLCDVDLQNMNPTVDDILNVLDEEVVAVVIQHYGGVPTDQPIIAELCWQHGIRLIEDCACAPASRVRDVPSGSNCDFGIWSFDAMKVLTAGDGGMLFCRDGATAAEIRRQTLLGQDNFSGQQSSGARWWEFNVRQPGRRAVMNDIEAAIGLAQFARLPELVAARRALWLDYWLRLRDQTWLNVPPENDPAVLSSYYTFWVQTERRDALASFLRERDIYTTYRYWPVHRAYGWESRWPNADWAADHTLNLPLHPGLTLDDIELICASIAEFGRTA
jgi:aminotransferase